MKILSLLIPSHSETFPQSLALASAPATVPTPPTPPLQPHTHIPGLDEISDDCGAFVQAESWCNSIKGCSRGCSDAGIWPLISCCGASFPELLVVKETADPLTLLINSLSKGRETERGRERESGGCGSRHLSPPLLNRRR